MRKNTRRAEREGAIALALACFSLLCRPAAAQVTDAVPVVPDLAGTMKVSAAPTVAVPLAPSLTPASFAAIQAPALSAPSAIIAQPALPFAAPAAAPAGVPALAPAIAPAAAASVRGDELPRVAAAAAPAAAADKKAASEAAPASEKTSALAVLRERVAAVNKPGAAAEVEIHQLYDGKNSADGAVPEPSRAAAGFDRMGNHPMATLKDAIALATKAHAGQKDKAGADYIKHPLRVMSRMTTDEEKMAAVLHDVVEDTGVTLQDLRVAGYPKSVVDAVDALSRRKGETYEQFIDRLKPNALAVKVKLADLEDNMDLGRIPNPEPKDFARVEKYRKVWQELKERERRDSLPIHFKYYAILHNGEARGLFAYNEGGKRLDMLAWNHTTQRWEHNPRTVSSYFISDLEAEEISRTKAEEIARGFGASVPSESDLMKISDAADAVNRSRQK